ILCNGARMHLGDIPIVPKCGRADTRAAQKEFLGPFIGALNQVAILGLDIHSCLRHACTAPSCEKPYETAPPIIILSCFEQREETSVPAWYASVYREYRKFKRPFPRAACAPRCQAWPGWGAGAARGGLLIAACRRMPTCC